MIISKKITSSQKQSITLPDDENIEIMLEIEKGEAELSIRSENRNPQTVSLNVIHRNPNTGSKITLNSIVKSNLRIDAKLTMEKYSQGSRGSISMNAIKIGKNAEAEFSPKLVVLNNDVKAEHKSSIQNIPNDI
ncbi:MAG: SufD family Fe-S cluster assembly protein, partial [Candidatus Micrarchaeota archaeon]|nr:SufD family Fe-S cluster assembly protein [Candidatus Micrarchaeota archaeon]